MGDIVGFQESFDNLFLMESLKQAVSVLDRNGLELIRGYYLDGVTQKELAEQYGVNQPEISKKLKRLLLKMRRAAE